MKKKSKKNGTKAPKATTTAANPDLVPLTQIDKEKKAPKPKREPKAPKAPKEKKVSCLDAAALVLKDKGEPMQCKAMVEAMFQKKLWHTDAPTPAATLYSAILREMKKGKDSRFRKTDRGHFTLNA
jgi:hypothetical protein